MRKKALVIFFLLLLLNLSIFAQVPYLRIGGWRVRGEHIKEKSNQLYLTNPYVQLPSMMGSERLVFPYIIIDKDHNFIECGIGKEKVDFLSTSGLFIEATSYQFTNEGLFVSGIIHLPTTSDEEINIEIDERIVLFDKDGYLRFKTEANIIYNLFGFEANAKGIETRFKVNIDHLSSFSLKDVSLKLPTGSEFVKFSYIHFFIDGNIIEEVEGEIIDDIIINGMKISISSCILKENSLYCSGWIEKESGESDYREFKVLPYGKLDFNLQ